MHILCSVLQEQQNGVMKALAENVSRLEGSWDSDRAFISALQHERASSTENPMVSLK
jgi:hypothetical protein